MPNIFETIDPRGFKVICSEECWNEHILEHHPFMKGWEEDVQKAIEQPSIGIYQDALRPERNIYYRLRSGKPHYIKVVVEFQQDTGSVITAFPADSGKAGEKLIWVKSNP